MDKQTGFDVGSPRGHDDDDVEKEGEVGEEKKDDKEGNYNNDNGEERCSTTSCQTDNGRPQQKKRC